MILGIDPGLTGAMAWLDFNNNLIAVEDMPLTSYKKKKIIDAHKLCFYVDIHAKTTELAAIEQVGAHPGQGVVSAFTFGVTFGMAISAVASFNIPHTKIHPSVWKSDLNLSRDKDLSRQMAMKLWPSHLDYFKRKKDDGRAEAALIAYYILKCIRK